jgi:Co/Zn/Cd efflux system component
VLGLAVNVASAWLLSGGHEHGHGHGHGHHAADHAHDETRHIATGQGPLGLSIVEDGVTPRFRLTAEAASCADLGGIRLATARPDGGRQDFPMIAGDRHLLSRDEVPEPHQFTVEIMLGSARYETAFEEHGHDQGHHHRDNNMRAALVHVLADAAVSAWVIAGLVLARFFGWLWMDPVAGLVGAVVIASWSYRLVRDTGAILLDMTPDRAMADRRRRQVEAEGDAVVDLHLWRLGPGHLGAIVAVETRSHRNAAYILDQTASSVSQATQEPQSRSKAVMIGHGPWSDASHSRARC